MKRLFLLFILVSFSVSAQVQNDVIRRGEKLFLQVNCVKLIEVNDGLMPIEYDPLTAAFLVKLERFISGYAPNEVHIFEKTGTRLVMVPRLDVPFRYQNGGMGTRNLGRTLFVISRDELSYIAIFLDRGTYTQHFNRKAAPSGSEYSARNDQPIIGVDANFDQKNLYQLLHELLPFRERQ